MIAAHYLTKTYKKATVLKNISFPVPTGKILAICGANGAGKTTLLKMLALILKPDAGQILIDGKDAWGDPGSYKKLIGYVPQANALFYELTVKENLDYWRTTRGFDDATALLGLNDVLHKKASSLSGGMQRRLNLALGLMNDPSILIMDEPLTGMDIKTRLLILDWMVALREKGMTIIYATHHTDEIANTADELILLRNGAVSFRSSVSGLGGEAQLARLFSEYI